MKYIDEEEKEIIESLRDLNVDLESYEKALQTIQSLKEVQTEIRRELRKKLDIREELEEILIASKHLFLDKSNAHMESKQTIWGWKESVDGKMCFHIMPTMLQKEICPKLSVSHQILTRVSKEKGWLPKKSIRIDGLGPRKVYTYTIANSS